MPPKQKEVKKGPAYKAAILSKDIVPVDIKEPPREPKPLRVPESFPEPPKNVTRLLARTILSFLPSKRGQHNKQSRHMISD
jgi:hypothetical protein